MKQNYDGEVEGWRWNAEKLRFKRRFSSFIKTPLPEWENKKGNEINDKIHFGCDVFVINISQLCLWDEKQFAFCHLHFSLMLYESVLKGY